MKTKAKKWIVSLGEHGGRAIVTLDRVNDLILSFEDEGSDEPPIAMLAFSSLHGCNLGLALLDASREAGAAKAKANARKRTSVKLVIDPAGGTAYTGLVPLGLKPKKRKKRKARR